MGGPQGAYLEGFGFELIHFRSAKFPPEATLSNPLVGERLTESGVLCKNADPAIKITKIECEKGGNGAYACKVDADRDVCGITAPASGQPDAGVAIAADRSAQHDRGVIIVRGYWDANGKWKEPNPDEITISCDGKQNGFDQHAWADGAIASCVRLGYEPGDWSQQAKMDDRADREQFLACIRAFRADYCGDGRSFTRHGTNIDIHDAESGSGPKKRFKPGRECKDGRCYEAGWSSRGAEHIQNMRWQDNASISVPVCNGFKFVPPAGKNRKYKREKGKREPAVLTTRAEVHYCQGGGKACSDDDDDRCDPDP